MPIENTEIDDLTFGYHTEINQIEEENKILKDTITHLKNELNRFQKTPLLVCEVKDVLDRCALIRLPNGNEFFVEGFQTSVFPHTRAKQAFHAQTAAGKLNGVMTPTTPKGCHVSIMRW